MGSGRERRNDKQNYKKKAGNNQHKKTIQGVARASHSLYWSSLERILRGEFKNSVPEGMIRIPERLTVRAGAWMVCIYCICCQAARPGIGKMEIAVLGLEG